MAAIIIAIITSQNSVIKITWRRFITVEGILLLQILDFFKLNMKNIIEPRTYT